MPSKLVRGADPECGRLTDGIAPCIRWSYHLQLQIRHLPLCTPRPPSDL